MHKALLFFGINYNKGRLSFVKKLPTPCYLIVDIDANHILRVGEDAGWSDKVLGKQVLGDGVVELATYHRLSEQHRLIVVDSLANTVVESC